MKHSRTVWHTRAGLLVALALTTALASTSMVKPVEAANQNSLIFPPGANPYGHSLGEWGGMWWDWMDQYPLAVSPITDDGVVTYGDADEQPAGPVWYLAGTFGGPGERWLDVPKGKALLMPFINWDAWSPEDCWWMGASVEPDACTSEDLLAFLDGFFSESVTDLSMTYDGQQINNLFAYRATSGSFSLNVEPDSLWTDFGYTPGPRDPNVSDGYYVMIKAPKVGAHTLRFTASVDGDVVQDMTYHLNVTN